MAVSLGSGDLAEGRRGDAAAAFTRAGDRVLRGSEIRIAGSDPVQNETEEQRERRRQDAEDLNREERRKRLRDEDAEERRVRGLREEGWLASFKNSWVLGIKEKDGYLSLKVPGSAQNPNLITDTQLRAMILKSVYVNGYTTLYAYRGNQIDGQLTSRMQTMIDRMKQPGGALEDYQDIRVSAAKMKDVEPWRQSIYGFNPLRSFEIAVEGLQESWKQWRHNVADQKVAKGFTLPAGPGGAG